MKISTKGRYALRLMLDLALQDPNVFVNIKSISQRQNISEKYLEQIITQLSKRKLVQSARGAQGGYKLIKAPKDYSIGEILRATEGSLAPVTCLEDGHQLCTQAAACATIDLWRDIQEAVNKIIDNMSLADLVDNQKKKLALLQK